MSRQAAHLLTLALLTLGQAQAGEPETIQIESTVMRLTADAAEKLGLSPIKPSDRPPVFKDSDLKGKFTQSGIDHLNGPRITARNGESAVTQIIRELRYPTEFEAEGAVLMPTVFETVEIGYSLTTNAKIGKQDEIDLKVGINLSTLDGWTGYQSGKSFQAKDANVPAGAVAFPVTSSVRLESQLTLQNEETVVLGGFPTLDTRNLQERIELEASDKEASSTLMQEYVFITVRTLDTEGEPTSGQTPSNWRVPPNAIDQLLATLPAAVPTPNTTGIPFAIPSEKAGFYRSPFAADSGFVDLRGFERGLEVKCPYTGKVFLVP